MLTKLRFHFHKRFEERWGSWVSYMDPLSINIIVALSISTSVFHVEQIIIFQVLRYIKKLLCRWFSHCIRSLFYNPFRSKSSLAFSIISLYHSLSPICITFRSIPGHSGILENDMVDSEAKSVHSSPFRIKLLPTAEIFAIIRCSTTNKNSRINSELT
mgnify:CR=1 FL=1